MKVPGDPETIPGAISHEEITKNPGHQEKTVHVFPGSLVGPAVFSLYIKPILYTYIVK